MSEKAATISQSLLRQRSDLSFMDRTTDILTNAQSGEKGKGFQVARYTYIIITPLSVVYV